MELLNYELRLIRCTLPSHPSTAAADASSLSHSPPSDHSFLSLIHEIVTLIESGSYADCLYSPGTRAVFQLADSPDPTHFYAYLERALDSFLTDFATDKLLLLISIAVSALLAFYQSNFTGPVIELPTVPLPWISVKEEAEWESWARVQLMSAGSDLAAKFSNLQYIVFAKILLMRTRDVLFCESMSELATTTWWLARLVSLQQQILDESCNSLLDSIQVFMGESLNRFGDVEKARSYWGSVIDEEEALTIVSMLQLEAGLAEHTYGRVDSARRCFKAAALVMGMEISVTGALGFRTIHQVEPKAQWVLTASRNSMSTSSTSLLGITSPQADSTGVASLQQNSEDISEVSDILMMPRILGSCGDEKNAMNVTQNGHASDVTLKPVQQAIILGECLLLEKSGRSDELQMWKMAPYIEAVDSQQSLCFSIKFCSNILRIRWESTRSRTKERALLMMNKVVQDLFELSPSVLERVHYSFGVCIPAVPILRKEYAQLLVSRGLVGEALKIFEGLELWDSLIYCYRLLEKKAVAVDLIKARLLEAPNDPRLWCSLGDVTSDDTCYEKALEASNDKSARAKRSLARSAYNRGDYERSKVLWESAMSLNTLYPDGWFALGAAALKARDINKALDGFTRAIQLDPDNGEAWNNLACLHMMRNKSEEAFIAFKEALKFKRNSWEMWKNYGPVAADVGNFFEAMKAIQRVLDLSGNKRYDGELLERIMLEMERRASSQHAATCSEDTKEPVSQSQVSDSRETQRMMEMLGNILKKIVLSVGSGDMWGMYARWHKIRGDLAMCLESLQKQVRSYQGTEVGNDIIQFRKFALASLELCKLFVEVASSTGSRRELYSAEMHLRNTIKRASAFSDTEEFKALQVCLDEVETRLKPESLAMS